MPLHLEVVTAERVVYSDEVDMVVAPGLDGALGILPQHAPLMSVLGIGELRITKGSQESGLAIGGGFLEVLEDRVTVLADTAERAEEIDDARAEEAQQRAQRLLADRSQIENPAALEAALRRAQVRLRVSRRRRNVRSGQPTP
ncbi:MAG: F0F1 ATP synthase subunit epsilon [Chloroflexota bacterium]|nr:F0F1 ATP synthase subunit epsilon [Chloroflexota bacterium]